MYLMSALKRLLLASLCVSIVAAFQVQLAAAVAVSEEVPVPGGTAAAARVLGIDKPPDPPRFAAEIIRLVYDSTERQSTALAALVGHLNSQARAQAPATDLVPLPLTTAVWSQFVLHRPLAADEIFAAILADRSAALLCRGLAALDDETLAFLEEHPLVLARLYEHG